MIALTESFTALLPGEGRRPLTADETAEVEDVLDAAAEWHAGRLPLESFARLGGIPYDDGRRGPRPSAGYTRAVAMMTATKGDPRRLALRRAVDALIRLQGLTVTNAGVFTSDELAGSGVVVR